MTTALDVARHLTQLAAAEPEGEPMTMARLHKLLYFCQGWHLAWYARPLFADQIVAADDGPILASFPETLPAGEPSISQSERQSVEQVWSHFKRYSVAGLRELSRTEGPWKRYHIAGQANEIPVGAMSGYFGEEFLRLTGEEPGSQGAFEADVAAGRVTPLEKVKQELGL
jgi:uncharacterized phage-associated protein